MEGDQELSLEDYYNRIDILEGFFIPNGLREYIETQETAKGYLFRACFNMIDTADNSIQFVSNINKVFELGGPDYGLGHYIMAYYYSHYYPNRRDDDMIISHGLKALNTDIAHGRKKTIRYLLSEAYESKKDYYNATRYYIEGIDNERISPIILDTYEPCKKITDEELFSIYLKTKDKFNFYGLKIIGNVFKSMEKDKELIMRLKEENQQLMKENKTIKAFPGGPDYVEALNNFNKACNDH